MMKTRKRFQYRLASTVSGLLTGIFSLISHANQSLLPNIHLSTPYSYDVAIIDRYRNPLIKHQLPSSNNQLVRHFQKSSSSFQNKAGTVIYKAMGKSTKQLQGELAGTALLYSLEHLGLGAPLKSGFKFLKEKTRYQFGDCGHVQLSSKKMKAESCITDGTKVNFSADYKLDAFSLDFHWEL